MRPEPKPIQTLLLQIFLPAVLLVATLLAVFAYNWHHSTILGGFDRKLIATSALTGAMIDPQDHDALIEKALAKADPETAEAEADYRRNVEPITRILDRLNLTYLYTQAIGGDQDIVYVLDGAVDDDHSPIGSPDDLSDQTLEGLRKTESEGSVYVSPIEYQEQWGLLKTAAAPVYNAEGQISSTAGADVNISLILVATQNALFASTLIGIGSIIACLFIALLIMRKVARPIEALKDQALSIAAGKSQSADTARGPREVAALSDALADMVNENAALTEQRNEGFAQENLAANIQMLAQTLGSENMPDGATAVHMLDRSGDRIFWVAGQSKDAEPILAQHAARQLAVRMADEPSLREHWRSLADTRHGICVIVDTTEETIDILGDLPVAMIQNDRELELRPGSPQAFNRTSLSIVVDGGPAIHLGNQL